MGIDAEMFVRTKSHISEAMFRKLRWEMVAAFGADRFWIWDDAHDKQHALERVFEYRQDGDTILPEAGETFLRVNLGTRYYGCDGYERGDLPFIVAVADFLERRVDGGEVWYGGDSSGVCAAPFGREVREKYLDHFAVVGRMPYAGDPRSGRQDWLGDNHDWAHRRCHFCDEPMMRNGSGAGFALLQCYGCGFSEQTHDHGKTWTDRTEVGGRKVKEKEVA